MYTIKGAAGTKEGYLLSEGSGEGGGPFWLGTIGAPKTLHRANQLVAAIRDTGIVYWDYPEGGSYIYEMYEEQGAGVTVSSAR
jgi:hypothetical protein